MLYRSGSSSLHYDPYENLLCVVCGSKTVHCFSPKATPAMYPLPVWGESQTTAASTAQRQIWRTMLCSQGPRTQWSLQSSRQALRAPVIGAYSNAAHLESLFA